MHSCYGRHECNRKVKESDFLCDEDKDRFICPVGRIPELGNRTGDDRKICQAQSEDCDQCPYLDGCCKSRKTAPVQFRLTIKSHYGKMWLQLSWDDLTKIDTYFRRGDFRLSASGTTSRCRVNQEKFSLSVRPQGEFLNFSVGKVYFEAIENSL